MHLQRTVRGRSAKHALSEDSVIDAIHQILDLMLAYSCEGGFLMSPIECSENLPEWKAKAGRTKVLVGSTQESSNQEGRSES